MNDTFSDEESAVKCVFCSEPVRPADRVRYRGAIAHAECARLNKERALEHFTRLPFIIGVIGCITGLLVPIPLILEVMNTGSVNVLFYLDHNISYILPAMTILGFGATMPFIAVGVYGFYRNYGQLINLFCALLVMVHTVFFITLGNIILTYGPDPQYTDIVSGLLMYAEMPGFELTKIAVLYITAIVSIVFGVGLGLSEGALGTDRVHRGFGAVLTLIGGLLFALHIGILLQFTLFTIIFLFAKAPREWHEEIVQE